MRGVNIKKDKIQYYILKTVGFNDFFLQKPAKKQSNDYVKSKAFESDVYGALSH